MARGPMHGQGWASGPGADGDAVAAPARAAVLDLQEGEVILLWLRPSLWRLALPVAAVLVTLGLMTAALLLAPPRGPMAWKVAVLGSMGALALAWFAADWWSHAYVLTSRRVISRVGLVWPMVAEAPLPAVWRVALTRSGVERSAGIGSVACLGVHGATLVRWSFVAHPVGVQEAIVDAVRRYGRGDVAAVDQEAV
jgi:hypothetical protein